MKLKGLRARREDVKAAKKSSWALRRLRAEAFLIPLPVKAVPEVIVGPCAVGFATVAFYV